SLLVRVYLADNIDRVLDYLKVSTEWGKPRLSGLEFLCLDNKVLLVRVHATVSWLCEMCPRKLEKAPFVADSDFEDHDTDTDVEAEAEKIIATVTQEIG
ncbi:hypothetical protein E2562_032282, partial [Oryza meyeriana var. granulata]